MTPSWKYSLPPTESHELEEPVARVYEIDGVVPLIHPNAFVHPDAVLIGDVVIGAGCYVGPLASLRGDFGRIVLEEGANIQDGCVAHCFPGSSTVVEQDGHVGHGAVLHGCRVGRGALIGMNSVLMDHVVVGERAFVGANSFVKSGFEVPAAHLATGSPAKVLRELTEDEMAWKANGTRVYQDLARRCRKTLKPAEPLVGDPTEHRRAVTTAGGEPVHVTLPEYRNQ
ncbi:phenylacetic acid degradation protein PaaY [Longimycelium tulufanense]|uniref:Phenylacetic acid degradation protein PaaY n=1 Tax=Longimycelium tulufanense TaxID=907463 RepID=A0A8J3CCE8_9PSEU|nr:transferase hexapeptide repeat family protein [Longimycelium tulufanense]GGM52937.1 phenylacetic acid degradation protein PaaY [Longimycelium tulufanense]